VGRPRGQRKGGRRHSLRWIVSRAWGRLRTPRTVAARVEDGLLPLHRLQVKVYSIGCCFFYRIVEGFLLGFAVPLEDRGAKAALDLIYRRSGAYFRPCSPKCLEKLSGKSLGGSDHASFGGAKRRKRCSFAPFRRLVGPRNEADSEFPDSL
jgi:hypothetical protein